MMRARSRGLPSTSRSRRLRGILERLSASQKYCGQQYKNEKPMSSYVTIWSPNKNKFIAESGSSGVPYLTDFPSVWGLIKEAEAVLDKAKRLADDAEIRKLTWNEKITPLPPNQLNYAICNHNNRFINIVKGVPEIVTTDWPVTLYKYPVDAQKTIEDLVTKGYYTKDHGLRVVLARLSFERP